MSNARILIGDVWERLSEIPDATVQTVITSPPYFGLRDYGTATWEGGSPDCDHRVGRATRGGLTEFQQNNKGSFGDEAVWVCPHCGANRIDSQMGLEETPEAYVEAMVALFREVRRVLKDDGTLWLNLGDSYFPHNGSRGNKTPAGDTLRGRDNGYQPAPKINAEGLKGKDLIGIPWRVAFALQADGWYLRSDIIWHKPNPMPESIRDRPTKSHEYLFLLTKSPRYYYDREAIREPIKETTSGKSGVRRSGNSKTRNKEHWGVPHDPQNVVVVYDEIKGANKRDVWTINIKPFKGAHFAVMPEALVEPCVLAGSAQGDTVLDPFTGSGTVAVVALRHGRNFIGTELNPEYGEIAYNRITGDQPLMNQVVLDFSTETKEAV